MPKGGRAGLGCPNRRETLTEDNRRPYFERAGLVIRGREARWLPCTLDAEPLGEATEWLERYRMSWEAGFDHLDEHLRTIQKGMKR